MGQFKFSNRSFEEGKEAIGMERVKQSGNRLIGRVRKGFLPIVISIMLGIGGAITQEVAAQNNNCAEVIRLSRQTASIVQTKDHFEEHAKNFCDEYRSSKSSNRSQSYGASYELLAASMSGSRTSEVQVASKYCSTNERESRRQDAYEQYLNTVSPGAFGAYEACQNFSSTGTRIDLSAVHEKEMFVNLTNSLDTGDARIRFSGTQGVNCHWDASDANEHSQDKWMLKPRSAAVVMCNRTSSTQDDSVIVYTSTSPNIPLTFPWSRYNEEGEPVDSLRDLQQQLATLERDVSNMNVDLGVVNQRIRNLFDIRTTEIIVRTQDQNSTSWPESKKKYVAPRLDPNKDNTAVYTVDNLACGQEYKAVTAWHEIGTSYPTIDFLHSMNAHVTDDNNVRVGVRARSGSSGYAYVDVFALCRLKTE